MTASPVRHLVAKDLYLLRWWSIGATVSGLVAAWLMSLGALPFNGGGVLMICALIVLNIFLVMNNVVTERKDRVSVFILTLPISRAQYVGAKVAANLLAFGVPWLVLTLAVAAVIIASAIPDGYLPLWMALLGYLLFYFCVLLGIGINTESTGWHATAITIGNVSVNFFIMLLFSLPSVRRFGAGPAAVWAPDVVTLTIGEIALGAVVLAAAAFIRTRRPDFT